MDNPSQQKWNERAEEIVKKYAKKHSVKSNPYDYIHEGLNPAEFASHLKQDIAVALATAAHEASGEERERCRLIVSNRLGENAHGFMFRATKTTKAVDAALTEVLNGIKKSDIEAFNQASKYPAPGK